MNEDLLKLAEMLEARADDIDQTWNPSTTEEQAISMIVCKLYEDRTCNLLRAVLAGYRAAMAQVEANQKAINDAWVDDLMPYQYLTREKE